MGKLSEEQITKAKEHFDNNPLTKEQAKRALKLLRNRATRWAIERGVGGMTKEQRQELEDFLVWRIQEGEEK